MKLLFAFCLLPFALLAATPVVCTNAHFTGAPNSSRVTITAVAANNPQVRGGVTYAGTPIVLTPTNGVSRTNLLAGDYTVSLAGITRTWTVSVPDSTNELNLADLAATLPTYTYTNVPPRALAAGDGIAFATNTPGVVTISGTAGGGGSDMATSLTNSAGSRIKSDYTNGFNYSYLDSGAFMTGTTMRGPDLIVAGDVRAETLSLKDAATLLFKTLYLSNGLIYVRNSTTP